MLIVKAFATTFCVITCALVAGSAVDELSSNRRSAQTAIATFLGLVAVILGAHL